MPAPGDQHLNAAIQNPFEDKPPRISEYTAQEIATLQSRLEKQLGPEYISSRAGPGGGKVHYVAAEKCIQLANEIFGFNGWSSTVKEWQVDFVDENATTLKVSMGISVIVRVTLRDGTFHEDIGYGHIENCKGKAAAFEKCKKEGTTDALKRALRNFGNALGNCIYDKDYLGKVTKMKVQAGKWDPDRLHRHVDHAPIKKELETLNPQDDKSQLGAVLGMSSKDTLEDEFDDGDFDDVDFSVGDPDSHPDEVVLPEPTAKVNYLNSVRNGPGTNGIVSDQPRPAVNRQQPMRPPNGGHGTGSNGNILPPQPQTPNRGLNRPTNGAGPGMQLNPPPAPSEPGPMRSNPAHQGPVGRLLHPSSRTSNGPPLAPTSPARIKTSQGEEDNDLGMPPPGLGFFSARAATMIPKAPPVESMPPPAVQNLPAFNPKFESPSIRKTPGIDHQGSRPVSKGLKQLAGSPQAPSGVAVARINVMNPQMDVTRRIGAPGSPIPMANRGQYKPPTMKRPLEVGGGPDRVPLVDLPANGSIGTATVDDGGDAKRLRLNS